MPREHKPVMPKLVNLHYNGIDYFAVDEGDVIIAFKDKAEALEHFKEVLDDFNEHLLETVEGTIQ